jgi:hypothetical protein
MMATATVIELKPVNSGRFTHAGYDPDTFTLTLRNPPTKAYPAGQVWQYMNISEEMADDFFRAESLGKYFNAHIFKNPDHPCSRVHESSAAEEEAPQAKAEAVVPAVAEDEDTLKLEALEVSGQVRALSIVSAEEYAVAGNELVRLRQMRKQAQERVDRIKKPAYETYKATLQLEHDVMDRYEEAEVYLDSGMARYRQRERDERLRREAEENRKRREEAEAEQKRKQAELAEQDAKIAEAQGRPEVAEQIRQQPLPLVPVRVQGVVLPKEVPKVKGIIERAPVWKWRVNTWCSTRSLSTPRCEARRVSRVSPALKFGKRKPKWG